MARKRDAAKSSKEPAARPWWLSPVFPLILLFAGLVLLVVDGTQPYRIWYRRGNWVRVEGKLMQAYKRRRYVRGSGGKQTASEYLERRPQKRIFKAVVKRGWPISRTKQVFRIRLNYTYYWKNQKLTKVADTPDRDFESKPVARRFLGDYVKQGKLKVWVNPKNPNQATAFLLYRWSLLWVRIGMVATALGLIWLLAGLLLGRAHTRQEKGGES